MNFLSPEFVLFFPAVLILSRVCPVRRRWLVLLPASWLFYAVYSPVLLGLLLLSTLISYLFALRVSGAESTGNKKKALVLGLVLCFAPLFLFKYMNFTLSGISGLVRLLGGEWKYEGSALPLPMGISFYTFQTASYIVDVYRGTVPAERHFGRYALFVSFFPQLVAGPIERPRDLLPQLEGPYKPDVTQGLRFLLMGYGKKVMVADLLAPFVNAVYSNPRTAGGAAVVIATALFALQIYGDFSGYSDIARGTALLLGVRLTENFRRPYEAVTIRDFWRRWHTSLNRWFTDYLYIPLGGSRHGTFQRCVNLFLVFLVSGLWHGADVAFLIWGALHGLYLVGETILFKNREPETAMGRFLRRCITLFLVGFAWLFFRAGTLRLALEALDTVFSGLRLENALSGLNMNNVQLLPALLAVPLTRLLDRLPTLPTPDRPLSENRDFFGTALLYLVLSATILLCRCAALTGEGDSSFIYFEF